MSLKTPCCNVECWRGKGLLVWPAKRSAHLGDDLAARLDLRYASSWIFRAQTGTKALYYYHSLLPCSQMM